MATLPHAYYAWRREPFPHGGSDEQVDELHADLALADSWVAESVIPFVERGQFLPAQVDVVQGLRLLRERAAAHRSPDRAMEYLKYVELLSDVYDAFLQEGGSPRTIYVGLIDEGVDVWRPVEATADVDGTFRLPDHTPEVWRFPPGSVVRCELRELAGGDALVAVEMIASPSESPAALSSAAKKHECARDRPADDSSRR